MRDRYKDIIKICKGYYNEKYIDRLSALKAYQAKVCDVNENNITYDDILRFGLLDVAQKYFTSKDFIQILYDQMWKRDVLFNCFSNDKEVVVNGEYICNLIISQIISLQIRDDNGNWIIDLSDYSSECII